MHDSRIPNGDTDQIADLHLSQAQRHILAIDIPAGLNDAGALADTAMPDHAGSQIGPGNDLLYDSLHLFYVHGNP